MLKSIKARFAVLFAVIACVCAFSASSAIAAPIHHKAPTANAATLYLSCPWACADAQAWNFAWDGYNPPVAQGQFPTPTSWQPIALLRISSLINAGGYDYFYHHVHFYERVSRPFLPDIVKYYSCPITTVWYHFGGTLATAWWDYCTQYA